MTVNDEYIIQLRNKDMNDLYYFNNLTNESAISIFNYIIETGAYENIEVNFEDEKNILMMQDFNKSAHLSLSEFIPIYAISNLLPSFSMFVLDYVVCSGIKLENIFTSEDTIDSDFIDFEGLDDDIKNIFFALSTNYRNIINVLAPNHTGPSVRIMKIGKYEINYMSKVYFQAYYETFYVNGILSNGSTIDSMLINKSDTISDDNNIVTEKKETKKTTTSKSVKKKVNKKTDTVEVSDNVNVDDYIKQLINIMYDYWMNDNYEWKHITEIDFFGINDSIKKDIFSKLKKKFEIDFKYDIELENYILKLKIKN